MIGYILPEFNKMHLTCILCFKEIKIHLFLLIGTFFGPSLFTSYAFFLGILYFNSFEVHDCVFSINRFAIFVPLLFGEFFLARENQKKTYIFLRTLPISDRTSYLSKNIIAASVLLFSEIPSFLLLYLYFDRTPPFIYLIIIIAFLVFITTSSFLLILKFGFRVTFLITNITAEILIYIWRSFEEAHPVQAAQIIASQSLFLAASIFLLIGTYIFYRLGVRHFQTRDTLELVA